MDNFLGNIFGLRQINLGSERLSSKKQGTEESAPNHRRGANSKQAEHLRRRVIIHLNKIARP